MQYLTSLWSPSPPGMPAGAVWRSVLCGGMAVILVTRTGQYAGGGTEKREADFLISE